VIQLQHKNIFYFYVLLITIIISILFPLITLFIENDVVLYYTGLTSLKSKNLNSYLEFYQLYIIFIPKYLFLFYFYSIIKDIDLNSYLNNIERSFIFVIILYVINYFFKVYYIQQFIIFLIINQIIYSTSNKTLIKVFLSIVFIFTVLDLKLTRGYFLMLSFPFLNYIFINNYKLFYFSIFFIFLCLLLMTFYKFSNTNLLVFWNLPYRLSFYNQIDTFLNFKNIKFHNNIPISFDFFYNLPFVRNKDSILNEELIFFKLFKSFNSGFAVSPELRSISFSKNIFLSFIDLSFFYFFLFSFIKIIIKINYNYILPALLIFLPILISSDTLITYINYLQLIIIYTIFYFISIFIRNKEI
jgi:hypothetical protein